MLTRIFENFDFLRSSESTFFFSNPYKTPEMNELDIELSKKSKIIEIGSVEKKLRLFKVGGISKKSGNLRIFVQLIYFLKIKLSRIKRISINLKKVFLIMLFQFWYIGHNIWYTLSL